MKSANSAAPAKAQRPSRAGQAAAREYRIRAGHYSLLAAILDPDQCMSNPTRRYRIIPRFRASSLSLRIPVTEPKTQKRIATPIHIQRQTAPSRSSFPSLPSVKFLPSEPGPRSSTVDFVYVIFRALLWPTSSRSRGPLSDCPLSQRTPLPPVRSSPFGVVPIFYLLSSIFLAAGLCGCGSARALKGGHAVTSGALTQKLVQSENPSASSRQSQETIKVRTYTLPVVPAIQHPECIRHPESSIQYPGPILPIQSHSSYAPPCAPFTIQNPASSIQPSASSTVLVTEREETRAQTELGAAQKDTAREIGAKLSSLKGIVWVGLALFIFGIASFAWPPLRAVVSSVTTSAAITLGGVALMILPTLIVGHELVILAGVALLVGLWFLAHRHGHLRGQLVALAAPKSDVGGSSIPTVSSGTGRPVAPTNPAVARRRGKPGEDGSSILRPEGQQTNSAL